MRSEAEIQVMLAKLTLIADKEREKGNKEHSQLCTAMGCGLRWVIGDWDFGLDERTLSDNFKIMEKVP